MPGLLWVLEHCSLGGGPRLLYTCDWIPLKLDDLKNKNKSEWYLVTSVVTPSGFVDHIKDSNRKQVLEIHLRVRGQMLHKHSCCTKIIKHWVAYWFHSLYQCYHVASGRNTVGYTCPSSLCVHLQHPRETMSVTASSFSFRQLSIKSVIFVCVFLIYNSDLEELSLRVYQQHNIVESIYRGWIAVNQFPAYCTVHANKAWVKLQHSHICGPPDNSSVLNSLLP